MGGQYKYNNFYEMLQAGAVSHPNKTVIFIDDMKRTYAAFRKKVDTFAGYLQSEGIGKGDCVALVLPNCEEFVISVFAVTKLGAAVVPINNLLKTGEFEYILNDCNARLLITSQKFFNQLSGIRRKTCVEKTLWIDKAPDYSDHDPSFEEVMRNSPSPFDTPDMPSLDDLAIIFYTSGTTGKPKGAQISYRNIFSNLAVATELFRITSRDRFIVYLPMFHAFTFSIMTILPFYTVSSLVIIRNLMPFGNILKAALFKRVTIFMGVPDIYNALIRADLPWYFLWFNSIRAFISGASPLNRDTVARFNKVFKRATMLEGYGLSECSPAVACNTFEHQKVGTVGLPLPGYEVKVVDYDMVELPRGEVGELIVKGDCVMQGYLGRPEATEEAIVNGWLRTGDLACVDEAGYITIVDRMKDLIISKGMNIYPREIEEELVRQPDIKAAAVIGVPEAHNGEIPVAYIELEEHTSVDAVDLSKIKMSLKRSLANFKVPRTIHIIDELPKNAAGKVLKRVLKEQLKQRS